ncbi:hypothetical protein [uncultured Arcticibacterium sp.]|uniref:hypothetical protein n=1 Tax=uncultured Arcticibacterium sp. TaxID=2173042 RepID=UPI0030F84A07
MYFHQYYINDYYSISSKQVTQNTEYIKINRKISPQELKERFPELKGVILDGRISSISNSEGILQNYINELFELFQLEELSIENYNLTTQLSAELWKPTLKLLFVKRVYSPNSQPLIADVDFELEEMSFQNTNLLPSKRLMSLKTIKKLTLDLDDFDFQHISITEKLERLSISTKSKNIDIDFRGIRSLKELNIYSEFNCNTKFDFSKCSNLKHIRLMNLLYLPSGIGTLNELEIVSLNNIGKPGLTQTFNFKVLERLHQLSIENCHFDYSSEIFLGKLPSIKYFSLVQKTGIQYTINEQVFSNSYIQNIVLEGFKLPRFALEIKIRWLTISNVNESIATNDFSNCEEITLKNITASNFGNLDLEGFRSLKRLTISNSEDLIILPKLGLNNENLIDLSLNRLTKLKVLPECLNECPNLKSIRITECPNIQLSSNNRLNELESFSIGKLNTKISKEIIHWRKLKDFSCHFDNYPKSNASYIPLITQLNKDESIANSLKEVICGLILGQENELKLASDFKRNLLKVFAIKKVKVQQLALQYINLLNNKESNIVDELRISNTLVFLSSTSRNAKKYKEDLDSLGYKISSKLSPETYVVVLNGYSTLPEKFFEHEHYFVSEADVTDLTKDINPGYIQTLESPELENLKKIIYSNKEENDVLLYEMIKVGGFPDSIIPELLIIAKTSKSSRVKSGLRKLLDSEITVGAKKILSNKINLAKPSFHSPFRVYESYQPNVSISQMAFTYFKRNGQYLHDFFNIEDAKNNKNRNQFFIDNWQKMVQKNHYINLPNTNLFPSEIDFILSQEQIKGNLKRLTLSYVDSKELFVSLAKTNPQLSRLEFKSSESYISDKLDALKKLKFLSINSNEQIQLPGSILNMEKLKEIYVWTSGNKPVRFLKSDIEKYGQPKFKNNFLIELID